MNGRANIVRPFCVLYSQTLYTGGNMAVRSRQLLTDVLTSHTSWGMTRREDEAYRRLTAALARLERALKRYAKVSKDSPDSMEHIEATEELAEASVEKMFAHRHWLKVRGIL